MSFNRDIKIDSGRVTTRGGRGALIGGGSIVAVIAVLQLQAPARHQFYEAFQRPHWVIHPQQVVPQSWLEIIQRNRWDCH